MDPVQPKAGGRVEKTILGHPIGLFVLFFTEMWERFSYYGMRAILMLYMTKYLLLTDEDAGGIYGDYTGLVYLTPLLGGFLADRYLGLRRSIALGAILMALGQGFLSLGFLRHLGGVPEILRQFPFFYLGLFVLIIGNGLFKPNISTLVGQLYRPDDPRRDGAFTIFYMGINLGACISPLVCGTIGEKYEWHWGFASAGIGMILGLLTILIFGRRHLGELGTRPAPRQTDAGGKPDPLSRAEKLRIFAVILLGASLSIGYAATVFMKAGGTAPAIVPALRAALWPLAVTFVATIWMFLMGRTKGEETSRVNVIFLLGLFVMVFWAAFEQAGSSLTLFADRSTELVDNFYTRAMNSVMGLFGSGFSKLEASQFQAVNALAIVIFAPVFSWLWSWLARRGKEPSTPAKMAIALFLNGMGYAVLYGAAILTEGGRSKVSPNWLFVAYIFQTWGELSLSPIGLSMVTRLAPVRFGAMIMGVWFLANAFANKLAGLGGGLYEKLGTEDLFGMIGLTQVAAGIILVCCVPFLRRLMGGVK